MNKNLNILIVEDELIAYLYLEDILNQMGYENIFHTTNFEDTISTLSNNEISIIFMDINISGSIDGLKCAKEIKFKNPDLPIIFTTAFADKDTLKEARETNLYGYLVKPFQLIQVEATLNVALGMLENKYFLTDNENIIIKDYNYNKKTKTLKYKDEIIFLSTKELNIVHLFFTNKNENISYELLLNFVWEGKEIAPSTIRDTISKVKKKLNNLEISNIKNIGYILSVSE